MMSDIGRPVSTNSDDAPGAAGKDAPELRGYIIGYVGALLLTAASFWAADTGLVWGPGLPVLLAVLAIAQMGVHLAFFLHISSAPDHANDLLALALGVFVVGLIIFGSLWIMANLNGNMMPMPAMLDLQSYLSSVETHVCTIGPATWSTEPIRR